MGTAQFVSTVVHSLGLGDIACGSRALPVSPGTPIGSIVWLLVPSAMPMLNEPLLPDAFKVKIQLPRLSVVMNSHDPACQFQATKRRPWIASGLWQPAPEHARSGLRADHFRLYGSDGKQHEYGNQQSDELIVVRSNPLQFNSCIALLFQSLLEVALAGASRRLPPEPPVLDQHRFGGSSLLA